jgi:TetR/AcrR family transcriptional regulator
MPKGTTSAPSLREERRLRQQEVSRTQLLDAAEEVFGRKGFHDTTLKEVAELAEFSVGSVYSFFESKDDLFRQIFVRRGEDFMASLHARLFSGLMSAYQALDPAVVADEPDPRERLPLAELHDIVERAFAAR